MSTPLPVHALTADEFRIAARDAGYVYNPDPCEIPGRQFTPLECAICEYVDAREALHAAEAIVYAFDASPAWNPTPSQGAVDYRRRIIATLHNRRETYAVKLATILGEIPG